MENEKRIGIIRYIYLYLVTAISIVLIIVSLIGFIRIGLEEWVFDVKGWEELEDPKMYYECNDDTLFYKYDEKGTKVLKESGKTTEQMEKEREECRQETMKKREMQHINEVKRNLVTWISMLLVALPLYIYHWRIIKKEAKK